MEPLLDAGRRLPLGRLHRHLRRHGYLAVPLPDAAAARASELLVTVPALLQEPAHELALAELVAGWTSSGGEHGAVTWGRRPPHDPRGGKCHLQSALGFERHVAGEPGAPLLLRAVVRRLGAFRAAAERLLAVFDVPLHCTVRANIYAADGGVPAHVDESALTVVFTARPGSLLIAAGGRHAPLRPVGGAGWHAIVLPGEAAGELLPGLVGSPHAAMPAVDGPRLSISVFASIEPAPTARPGCSRRYAIREMVA